MTHQEIYQQLNNVDQQTWTSVKELLSEYECTARELYIKKINLTNPKPIDYFVTAVIEDDCNGKRRRQFVDWDILNKFSIFRVQGRSKNYYYTFLEYLPIQFLQYLPTNIATRIRKVARENEINSSTKQLQLNEFSYQLFKAQLQTSKKKLSGNEAIAQIKKLPNPTDHQQREFYDKFLALFWEHLPKKSIDFCNCVAARSKDTQYSPIRYINDEYLKHVLNSTDFNQNEVMIGIYFYQTIARDYNIPVIKEFWTDIYSDRHDWVTGVPKSAPLNQAQLEMTVSQIIILNHIITNLQGDSKCPYFKKMLAHLLEEVHKPVYKDQLATLHKSMQASYSTATNTINLLGAN